MSRFNVYSIVEMQYFRLDNGLLIPAIGMGTGWMNKAYRHPRYLLKRVLMEIRDRVTGDYSKEKNYNASYELRKILKFSNSIRKDARIGYELFDTAYSYNNCSKLSKALHLDKNRDDYFIIAKCSNANQRNGTVLDEFNRTCKELRTDYVDLYLIHWPQTGCYKDTWKLLEELYLSGKVRAIGVSNFSINQLKEILADCRVKPMVNEVECHPMLQQRDVREFCKQMGIQLIAHTPTGKMRKLIKDSCLSNIAAKHKKTITQVILRWHYQLGDISIPNSLNSRHAKENLDILDFSLDAFEMDAIAKLDCGNRIWPDPENCDFTKL